MSKLGGDALRDERDQVKRALISCIAMVLVAASAMSAQADILGKDDRLTFPQYAKSKGLTVGQVEERFAATGEMACYKETD